MSTTTIVKNIHAPGASRSLVRAVLAQETSEGVGATVRRSIGTASLRNFTPFLMLDNFKVAEGAGFPDHPHRGMTTMTYMIEGECEHEDFMGHRGKLGPGDLQFMIAGKGVVHSEMPIHKPGGQDPFGLQLWIDLPKQYKLTDPSYQELKASEIPSASPIDGVHIKVICGETIDKEQGIVKSPVRPLGGCWFFDVIFEKGSTGKTFFQKIPKGWNAFVYTLEGKMAVGNPESVVHQYHTAVLSSNTNEEGVQVTSVSDTSRFVIVAGEPLDQQVVQHGPFVMTSRTEIMEAFNDYSRGTNGFEGARGWRSEIGRKMTDFM